MDLGSGSQTTHGAGFSNPKSEKPFPAAQPAPPPPNMPILLLLLSALVAGLLIGLVFDRLAPDRGATAAAADVVETVAESSAQRGWWRARTDPAVTTGLALTAAVALMIAGGFVVGLLALLVRDNATVASIDASVAAWGNEHANHLSTRALWWVTDLGDWPIVPLVGIAILLHERRRAPSRSLFPFLLLVYAGDEAITTGIKALVDRARPTLNPIAETLGPSFPSGHSSTAASFYAALALILARRRGARVRALLAGSAAAIAVGVAASRVLLDVHWLSDVIAGVMLGWAWFALCAVAFGGRRLAFAEPLEQAAAETSTPPQSERSTGRPAAKV
jgi:membrane-associated phospholipid phosphatase